MFKNIQCMALVGSLALFSACDVLDDDDNDNGDESKLSSSSFDYTSSSSSQSAASSSTGYYSKVKGGAFSLTRDGEPLYDEFWGHANLVVSAAHSEIKVYAGGLSADTTYNTHVHNDTCANGGGDHYLQNSDGEDTAENGLWPTLEIGATGSGQGSARHNFVVSGDARSVVIHEPDSNARIACADLTATSAAGGQFELTTAGGELYDDIHGTAFVAVSDEGWSKADAYIAGLTPSTDYSAHVHVESCLSGGGSHYLQDTSGEDIMANGLWPTVTVNTWGEGFGWHRQDFRARVLGTRSVVIHEPGSGTRIACADLTDGSFVVYRSGSLAPTDDGTALYGDIEGRARLLVEQNGVSRVHLYASGLSPDTQYDAHVHNGICENGGGSHYLQDPEGNDEASNGLFPTLTTNTNGEGWSEASNGFIVRPDARSVIIHEPGSGARIACADLN